MAPSRTELYSLLSHWEAKHKTADGQGEEYFVDDSPDNVDRENHFESSKQQSWWSGALFVTTGFACSALTNLILVSILIFMLFRVPQQDVANGKSKALSKYAGLSEDPAFHFPYSVGYGPEITNHTLADERWEAIDIDPGIVALPTEWAQTHNLPPSQPFPWEPSKGVYTITAFHTLHCLKNIHRLLYDAHHGRPLSRDIGHALHCLDHMRKDAMCNADDFLLPTPPDHYDMAGPRGQSRVCRSWDQLLQWANEHSACYQHMDDNEEEFAKSHKEIERYRNCPHGSPYERKMNAYFEEVSHQE